MFCITTNVRWYLILQGYYWRTSDNGGTLVIFRDSASLHWFTQPFHQHIPQYSDCSSLPPSEARSVQLNTLYDTYILTLRHSFNRYVPHLIWEHPCLSIEKSSVFFILTFLPSLLTIFQCHWSWPFNPKAFSYHSFTGCIGLLRNTRHTHRLQ